MRKMIVDIGYNHYAFDPRDAMALLTLFEHAQRVEQPNYSGPWVVKVGENELIQRCEMGDVVMPTPPEPEIEPEAAKPLAIAAPLLRITGPDEE
jgi:hypothetical protein